MHITARAIVQKLQKAGFEAYFAGGSVRDKLMGKRPKDYDIATSATPEAIESLLSKTIPIGKQFGVILVVEADHHFEVATFRSDSALGDGRRPDAVYFTNAKEDALRRDFTINGLFYDPIQKKYFDYVDGKADIQKKLIRFIGEPAQRIQEDHLRMLRAIRFKNRIGFNYGPQTRKAILAHAHLIQKVSGERIGEELTKMMIDQTRSQALRDLSEFGLLRYILPEVEALKKVPQPYKYHQEGDGFEHTCRVIDHLPKKRPLTKSLIFAALFHDIGKVETFSHKSGDRIRFNGHSQVSEAKAEIIARRLKFSKDTIEEIKWLIHHHMMIANIPDMTFVHQRKLFAHPYFDHLMWLHRADEMGSVPVDLSLYRKIRRLQKAMPPEPIPEPDLVSGHEIMERFNLPPCPQIGHLKEKLHDAQIEGKVYNKQEALKWLASYLRHGGE